MFTGIVEAIGSLRSIERGKTFARVSVSVEVPEGCSAGDSVAVDGACLTVTSFTEAGFDADLSVETLDVTTLGRLRPNDPVNVEWALTLSKPLGGHLVTGHVDGVGTLASRRPSGSGAVISFKASQKITAQLVAKGSVAVDGVSLTVARLYDEGFDVFIVPHTLGKTTLAKKKEGSAVNLETDIIGKYVERFLGARRSGSITEGFLAEHGFLKK